MEPRLYIKHVLRGSAQCQVDGGRVLVPRKSING